MIEGRPSGRPFLRPVVRSLCRFRIGARCLAGLWVRTSARLPFLEKEGVSGHFFEGMPRVRMRARLSGAISALICRALYHLVDYHERYGGLPSRLRAKPRIF